MSALGKDIRIQDYTYMLTSGQRQVSVLKMLEGMILSLLVTGTFSQLAIFSLSS